MSKRADKLTPIRAVEDRTLGARIVSTHSLAGDGAPLAKPDKPDFEVAVRTRDGAIHVLGSGSAAKRCVLARIDPNDWTVTLRRRAALYRRVQDALDTGERPNLEGAIVAGERLRLFNRAAGRTPNASVDMPLDVLRGAAPRVLAMRRFELGELDGVPLGFTDVAALPDGRCAFLAAAEDTPDAIADGPVAGSVLGLLEHGSSGRARTRSRASSSTRILAAPGFSRTPTTRVLQPSCCESRSRGSADRASG